jgi:hypothetical protein
MQNARQRKIGKYPMKLRRQNQFPFCAFALASILIATLAFGRTPSARQPAPQSAVPPRVFVLHADNLLALRARIVAGNVHEPGLDSLRTEANELLKLEPLSVTQKPQTPPSGDKHDYISLAPYWWPNPAAPGGVPYIRRDGETNPAAAQVPDHKNFSKLMSATRTLALAYYLLGDQAYAAQCAKLLRVWFLDPATRMNPSLTFAQAVIGRNEGRGTGLIETREITQILDAVGLLTDSRAWTAADQQGMQDWCSRFLQWMLSSSNGKDESAAKNNHGTYYDVQIIALALFVGKKDVADRVLREAPKKRIEPQVEPDGRQPLELARTKSAGYSLMNLSGLFELARLGDATGADLWSFQTKDGRSIRKALDYLVPFGTGERKWTGEQIAEVKWTELIPELLAAADKYQASGYRDAAMRIDPNCGQSLDALLLHAQSQN